MKNTILLPLIASLSLCFVPACDSEPELTDDGDFISADDDAEDDSDLDEDEDTDDDADGSDDVPVSWSLSYAELIGRANAIKSVHANDAFIDNPVIFAGIARAETGMAHCYNEYSGVKCQGNYAATACGGGAILAGGWDGTCDQGGLGMFQFDNGTQWQTRNFWLNTGMWPLNQRRHHDVADLNGNIRASIDFVLWKAWYSGFTPYFGSQQAMYDWVNSIRPIPGDPDFERWLGFLAHNYNGQSLYTAGWYEVKTKYRNATTSVYNDLGGDDFWYGGGGGQPCTLEGGLWCGGNGVEGDAKTLYVCSSGTLSVQSVCTNGCYYAAPGWNDYCY